MEELDRMVMNEVSWLHRVQPLTDHPTTIVTISAAWDNLRTIANETAPEKLDRAVLESAGLLSSAEQDAPAIAAPRS